MLTRTEVRAAARDIAKRIGETEKQPLAQIRAIIRLCGLEFAEKMVEEALAIEANGGLMTRDGQRRRTLGGVYFFVARGRMGYGPRRRIFGPAQQEAMSPAAAPFVWEARAAVVDGLRDERGELRTVKVTLIGRPGRVQHFKDVVVTTMTHTGRYASLPRGVPPLPEQPTLYTVYIAARQWRRIEQALQADPTDELLVEGAAAFDPQIGGITVHATSATTRLTAARKHAAAQAETAATESPPESAPRRAARPQVEPTPPAEPAPSIAGAPADVNQKLQELHAAARMYRQKIAALQAKPPNQRFGLEMTQKLLKNTEQELQALLRKHGG